MNMDDVHQKLLQSVIGSGMIQILSSPDINDEKFSEMVVRTIFDDFIVEYFKLFSTKHGSKKAFCRILTSQGKNLLGKYQQFVNWSNGKHHNSLPKFILAAICEFVGIEKNGFNLIIDEKFVKTELKYNGEQIQSCLESGIGLIKDTCLYINLLDIDSQDLLQYTELIYEGDFLVFINVNTVDFEESDVKWEEKSLGLLQEITDRAEKSFNGSIILDIDGPVEGTLLSTITKFSVVKEILIDKSVQIMGEKIITKSPGILLSIKRKLYGNGTAYLKILQENVKLKAIVTPTRENWLKCWTKNDENYVATLVSLYTLSSFNSELQEQFDSLLQKCTDTRLVFDTAAGWYYKNSQK